MKKFFLCIILVSHPLFAQSSEYAGSFLEIPVGARAMGMGNAFVSIADDGTAFHYNPAGAALSDDNTLSTMYSSQYGSIVSPLAGFFFVGYTQQLQEVKISVDWVRLSVDGIPREPDLTIYDSPVQRELMVKSGTGSGFFASADDAVYLDISRMFTFDAGVGWSLPRLKAEFPVGINFKIVHRSLDGHKASGVGIDGGFMLRFPLGTYFGSENRGRVSFGMNLRDITDTRIAWDTQTGEVVPASILWGISYSVPVKPIDGKLLVAFDRDGRYGDMLYGAEYSYHDMLSVRAGANASRLSAGAGVRLDFMRVDYALLTQDLGNVHRVSADLFLGEIFK